MLGQGEVMEKYSVSQQVQLNKQSSTTGITCPVCGKPAKQEGVVLWCPEHGTEPWEKPKK
jgi:hypothetical protein